MSPELAAPPARRPLREPDVPPWLLPGPAVVPARRRDPAAAPAVVGRAAGPAVPAPGDYVLPPLPAADPARPEPRLRFRADVEGLRGLAVLLAVLHAAGLPGLPGGLVGVDVLFVLAGYLTTALLVAQVRHDGSVGLLGHYARRCRRLLPAVAVVLALTCALGALLLPPADRLRLARDTAASALLGGDWLVVARQAEHPSAVAAPGPLLHLGPFGVAELLLVAWPALFVAALVGARRCGAARTTALAVVLAPLTVASLAAGLDAAVADAGRTAAVVAPLRGWQFAVGAWLALLLPVLALRTGRAARAARAAAGTAGLAALGWAAVAPAAGAAAVAVPALAAAALLAAGCGRSARPPAATRLLGSGPLRRLGGVAFTWYLWHWPLVALVAARAGDLGWPVRLAVVLAALGPAALTTRWVERPLRGSAAVRSRPRAGLALGLAAVVLPVCAAALLAATVTGTGAAADRAARPDAGRVDRGVVRFDDTRTAGPVTPAPAAAAADRPQLPTGCLAPDGVTADCLLGGQGPDGAVVLLGDDRAGQWLPAAQALAAGAGTSVRVLTRDGCTAAAEPAAGPDPCARWREDALRTLAREPRPALVLVSAARTPAADPAGWERTLGRLAALGAPVVYVADTPRPGPDVPGCVAGALDDWSRCAVGRAAALPADPVAAEVARGRLPGVRLVDVADVLCPPAGGSCPAVRGGVLLYRDGGALTDTAARALAPQVVAAVRGQLDAAG